MLHLIYIRGTGFFPAGVAQLVEHVLGKDGVTGSIPVSSLNEAQTYVAPLSCRPAGKHKSSAY